MAKRLTHQDTPLQALVPVKPSLGVLLLFAVGQMGWSLASYAVGNLLVYFYMPPEQGTPVFPAYIYQGAVLGVLTLVGILSAGGRLIDGVLDPMVAAWSDGKQSPRGKRRWFLLRGAIPFALFATLVFFPPENGESASNFMWLAVIIALYYFFFAFYVIPYNALMAELGHTASDRMLLSTLVSVAWALGFIVGNSAFALQGLFESQGLLPVAAFQRTMIVLHGVAAVLMLAPALLLNEQRYARQAPGETTLRQALRIVLGNRNFRWFLLSYLLYWLALTFIQLGVVYYATLLFGLDKSAAFTFSLASFLSSFILYVPLNFLVKAWGKRRTMLAAYLLFGLTFAVVIFVKSIPFDKTWLLYTLALVAAGPLATFGILPNALIGDEIERENTRSGQSLSGMFFGVSAFTMKVGISLANLIFPSLLLMGKSAENPLGVQCTALAALFFCLAGWWAFRNYRETAV